MRWALLSVAAAIALIMLGFFVIGGDNLNIAEKTTYWFCVVAFLTAQGFHLLNWVRRNNL